MKTKEINVSDLINFLKTVPLDAKIRVLQEINIHYNTSTEFSHVSQYCEGDFVDGIYFYRDKNTIDFGIK